MKPIKEIIQNILDRPKPAWLNQQMVLIILVLLVLFTTLAWSKPITHNLFPDNSLQSLQITPTVGSRTPPTPSPSPLPQEWIQNSENTNDIVLVGVLLVLIVIGGTYHAIRQNKNTYKE